MADATTTPDADLQVPMPVVIRFVRQLSHDLRNNLNAAELQGAYITEIVEDPEAKAEVKRLREMMSELSSSLQKLTAALGDLRLTPMEYPAAEFVEDTRNKLGMQFPETKTAFEWQADVGNAVLAVDPQFVQQALLELTDNALRHRRGAGPIRVSARIVDNTFVLSVAEPKVDFAGDVAHWGREPMKTLSHGHYGLGLYRARRIIEAHGGQLEAHYDAGTAILETRIRLPLAPAE